MPTTLVGTMGRPKLNKRRFMTSLPADLCERLDVYAARRSKTRADVLELAAQVLLGDVALTAPPPKPAPARRKGKA